MSEPGSYAKTEARRFESVNWDCSDYPFFAYFKSDCR